MAMTWCAILLICLLPEGLAPGTKGTEVPEPERLKAIAERLSEAPEELNRKRADEEQELVEDIISIAAIAKQEPALGERAAGVLTRVLQRETKRDASSDLKPWERVQLAAALVLVKIEGKNAAGPLQAFYERSRAPVVWARLEPHLAELGLKDADHRLKSEERSRREKILAAATETARN
jgi:hypothetical protein